MHKLADADWQFTKSDVPDHELVVCLLWEFLRESQAVRQLALDWSDWFARGQTATSHEEQSVLWKRTQKIKSLLNSPLRFDEFISLVVVQGFGFKKLIDTPWQRLPAATRDYVVQQCRANPPVFIGYDMHAAELANAARKLTNAEMDKSKEGGVFSLPQARAPLQTFRVGDNMEALLLVVDWGLYDNNAILKGFSKLAAELIKTRPKGTKPPRVRKASGLSRYSEWRGKLSDLGIARLSRYQAQQLRREMPHAYKILASTLSDDGPTAVEKKMASARRRFKTNFREILPFEKKMPICLVNPRFASK